MTILPFSSSDQTGCLCSTTSTPNSLVLPVAPLRNHRRRFEKYDPNVRAVPPQGALTWVAEHARQGTEINTITIAGPGDPLADVEPVCETLKALQAQYPRVELAIATIGIHSSEHAGRLSECGLSKVILKVDAMSLETAKDLYAWIRPDRKTVPLPQAVSDLIKTQSIAVKIWKERGCRVEIMTTVYPGYNDGQIEPIARIMAENGAERLLLCPYKSQRDLDEEAPGEPDAALMSQLREAASRHIAVELCEHLPQLMFGLECPSLTADCRSISANLPTPSRERPNVAVVSSDGMSVDLHLGQAYQVLIYGPREDGLACLLGTRPVPEPGGGGARWQELAVRLGDCFALLAASAGENPRKILADHGITVMVTEDEIEGCVDRLYGGGKKGGKR